MPIDFNEWDSEMVTFLRVAERFAHRLDMDVTIDPGKVMAFIEAGRFHSSTTEVISPYGVAHQGSSLEDIDRQIADLQRKRAEIEAAELAAAQAGNARRATALLAAMKEAYRQIQDMFPETFADDKYAALATAQAWPRDTKFKRAADLSETEMDSARAGGRKAVAAIK